MDFLPHLAPEMWLFYAVIFLYSVVSSLGIGGIALLTFFLFYFDPKESIGLITIFFLYQNINKLFFFHKHIDFSIAKKVVLFSIPGAIVGSYLLQFIPTTIFEKMLAVFIIVSVLNNLFLFAKSLKASYKSIPIHGFFYGFSSGFLGSGNMLRGTLFLNLGLIKEAFVGTSALTAFCINIPKLITYGLTDIISLHTFWVSLPMLGFSIIGTFFGKKLLKKVKDHHFVMVINGVLLISAVVLLIK